MHNRTKNFAFYFAFIWLVFACKKAKEPIEASTQNNDLVVLEFPSYFPKPLYDFQANPLSKKKIELGRMLFYDPILSRDSSISCASCHQPYSAFSHLEHSVSHGIDRKLGNRNAPGLFNLAWMPNFMWDGAVPNIEVQPVAPITNHVEMDETISNVLIKLNRHPNYRSKFSAAFGTEPISSSQMLKSIAQFMLTIVSGDSKYDQYMQGKTQLEASELAGLKIVEQKCTPCHAAPLFTDFTFRNIGLDSTAGDPDDIGRQAFTGSSTDRRKFKVPSLRNFSLTKPYLHNGTVYGMAAVLARHDTLIQDNPNLDPILKQNGKLGLGIKPEEIQKIYDFVYDALADKSISNPSFLTPFDSYVIVH